MKAKNGPRTVPLGTQYITLASSDLAPSTQTCCFLSQRKSFASKFVVMVFVEEALIGLDRPFNWFKFFCHNTLIVTCQNLNEASCIFMSCNSQ